MRVAVEARYYPNLLAHAFAVMGLANSIDTYSPEIPSLLEQLVKVWAETLGENVDQRLRRMVETAFAYACVFAGSAVCTAPDFTISSISCSE